LEHLTIRDVARILARSFITYTSTAYLNTLGVEDMNKVIAYGDLTLAQGKLQVQKLSSAERISSFRQLAKARLDLRNMYLKRVYVIRLVNIYENVWEAQFSVTAP